MRLVRVSLLHRLTITALIMLCPLLLLAQERHLGVVDEIPLAEAELNLTLHVLKRDWVELLGRQERPDVNVFYRLRLPSARPSVMQKSLKLEQDNADSYFDELNLVAPIGSYLDSLTCTLDGFYTFSLSMSLQTSLSSQYMFSLRVQYSQSAANRLASVNPIISPLGNNAVLVADERAGRVEEIMRIDTHRNYRDVAASAGGTTLVGVNHRADALVSFDLNNQSKRQSSVTLISPEGVATDSHGNIYIADWGQHRIVKLDASYNEVTTFGSLGRNQVENVGEDVLFTFPARIAIEEPRDNRKDRHLIVSDWYGIKKIDSRGKFLDTVFAVNPSSQPGFGTLMAISVNGYGPSSKDNDKIITVWTHEDKGYHFISSLSR